jgi:hypothetical protein
MQWFEFSDAPASAAALAATVAQRLSAALAAMAAPCWLFPVANRRFPSFTRCAASRWTGRA